MVEVRPIRNEQDYHDAREQVAVLWGSHGGTSEGDRLDILVTLIGAYEATSFPIDPPDPIKFRMEQQGLTRKDLEGIIGTRGRITEVLEGKRGLSIAMIRRLHSELGIPADILIRPSRNRAA